jgi:hypothetical protein
MAATHIARQLVRSATGGGANYYWLQLTKASDFGVDDELPKLLKEADELVAILTSSIRTAKQRDARGAGPANRE